MPGAADAPFPGARHLPELRITIPELTPDHNKSGAPKWLLSGYRLALLTALLVLRRSLP